MHILQVIAGLHKIGGTTTFVGGLANALARLGNEVTIATYRKRDPDDEYPLDSQVRVAAISEVEGCPRQFDVVHVHGLWDRDVFWASGWALKHGIPFVWSPHGMLAPWSLRHRWWKKSLPWHLYLKRRLKKAAAIHVTAELEKKWIEDFGFGPVVVAPLGTEEGLEVREFESSKVREFRVLFVGRVHPVKGLENLVRAVEKVRKFESLRVRIVGPDDGGHLAELKKLAADLDVAGQFEWVGPKYGADLSAEYDNCDVLVLPSFTENFGGVVVDTLAHGKPVIASKFTPWQELENVEGVQGEDKSKLKVEVEEWRLTSELSPQVDSPSPSTSHFASPSRCGWWVDNDPETLAKTLREAMSLSDEERRRMGEVGRRLVGAKYTWSAVAKKMIECYNNLKV